MEAWISVRSYMPNRVHMLVSIKAEWFPRLKISILKVFNTCQSIMESWILMANEER